MECPLNFNLSVCVEKNWWNWKLHYYYPKGKLFLSPKEKRQGPRFKVSSKRLKRKIWFCIDMNHWPLSHRARAQPTELCLYHFFISWYLLDCFWLNFVVKCKKLGPMDCNKISYILVKWCQYDVISFFLIHVSHWNYPECGGVANAMFYYFKLLMYLFCFWYSGWALEHRSLGMVLW